MPGPAHEEGPEQENQQEQVSTDPCWPRLEQQLGEGLQLFKVDDIVYGFVSLYFFFHWFLDLRADLKRVA